MEGLTPSLLGFMLLLNLPPLLPPPQLNILMLDVSKAVWASFSSLSTLPIQGSLFTSLILMLLTYQWNLNYSSSDLYIYVIISIKPPASNLTWPKGNVHPPSSTPNLRLSEILQSYLQYFKPNRQRLFLVLFLSPQLNCRHQTTWARFHKWFIDSFWTN